MLIAPEANNCFSVIFRGEYQELQNNRLKHKNRHNCSCACMYAAIVLMISLHVQQLRINLLIEFSSKTNERNTTESKLIWYLCFISVIFIQSCYYRLKVCSFSLKKKKFWSVDLTCWWPMQALNLRFLKALNTCTSSWKGFWSKGNSSHFEYSLSFQISWTWSGVFRINENFIQHLSDMFTCQDGKDEELSNKSSSRINI